MTEQSFALDYAPARRRRRWLAIAAGSVAAAIAIAFVAGPRCAAMAEWFSDLSDRRTILRGATARGTLDLTSRQATLSAFLNENVNRARTWGHPTSDAYTMLFNLTRPRPAAGTGDIVIPFVGRLTARDGSERLVTLGWNVSAKNDYTNAVVSFHVELFAIGTWRTPAFTAIQANLDPTASDFPGAVFGGRHWATFSAISYRPGDSITIGAPALPADDPATIRLPVSVGGVDDAILFTLGPNDVVSARRESGRPLPFARPPATQSATRSAA